MEETMIPIIGADAAKLAGLQMDLLNKLRKGKVTLEELELFLRGKNPFEKPTDPLEFWDRLCRRHFGTKLGSVNIPEKKVGQEEFSRLLIFPKGLTNNRGYNACAKLFPCWRYADDLDKAVSDNERDPRNGAYAIWVRDGVEADEAHKNKSANDIKRAGIKTETLLEREVHELVYFLETGKHLDIKNVTLCSGSRNSDGYVPDADWFSDGFGVSWARPGSSSGSLRSREVVVA